VTPSSPPSNGPGLRPPQNTGAEEQVLGAIFLDPQIVPDVLAEIRAEDFYKTSHRVIFQAQVALFANGTPVDILTVVDFLKKMGKLEAAGGPEGVGRLTDDVSTTKRAVTHAKLVREASILRQLQDTASQFQEIIASGESNAVDLLGRFLQSIEEISNNGAGRAKWEVLTARQLHDMKLSPPPELVRSVLSEGSVGFIGGEPKMRKSWIACDLALAISSGGKFLERFETGPPRPVLFVEEEDHEYRMDQRLSDLWASRTAVSELPLPDNLYLLIRKGFRIDDASQFSRMSNLVATLKPALVIFDSLTRIHNLKTNLDSDIKPVLDAFDRLAREHGCAVLTIHHYAKQTQGSSVRGGQRLRGSGDIHARSEGSLYVSAGHNDTQIMETESKDHEGQRLLIQFDGGEGATARLWAVPLDTIDPRSIKSQDFLVTAISALSPQFAMSDGRIPLEKLQERTGKSLPTLRKHLNTLEKQGLVTLSPKSRGRKNPWVKAIYSQDLTDTPHDDPNDDPHDDPDPNPQNEMPF